MIDTREHGGTFAGNGYNKNRPLPVSKTKEKRAFTTIYPTSMTTNFDRVIGEDDTYVYIKSNGTNYMIYLMDKSNGNIRSLSNVTLSSSYLASKILSTNDGFFYVLTGATIYKINSSGAGSLVWSCGINYAATGIDAELFSDGVHLYAMFYNNSGTIFSKVTVGGVLVSSYLLNTVTSTKYFLLNDILYSTTGTNIYTHNIKTGSLISTTSITGGSGLSAIDYVNQIIYYVSGVNIVAKTYGGVQLWSYVVGDSFTPLPMIDGVFINVTTNGTFVKSIKLTTAGILVYTHSRNYSAGLISPFNLWGKKYLFAKQYVNSYSDLIRIDEYIYIE